MAKKARAKPAAPKKPIKADRTERALRAKIAAHRGESLTQAQSRDLTWYERESRERIINETLADLPKGLYCQLAGRQHKLIDDAAERYDLPIGGPTVDMFDAVRSLHDLIAENASRLSPNLDGDEHDLRSEKLKQEIRKLQTVNDRLQIALAGDRGDTINRAELREMLSWFSLRIQGLGQQLRRAADGEEAAKTLNEFLVDLAGECESGRLTV